jgi:hypothetical protein
MLMIQSARITTDIVKEHLQALHTSSELTQWFRRVREPQVEKVTPEGIIAALHREGINPVLMGTHGLVGYRSESRATQDVDLLVTKRDVRKAVRILEREYPYLEVHDSSSVARFVDPVSQKVVIDVMKPNSRAMQLVFRHSLKIGSTHRIPDLEMALACKFIAMIAPNRREEKRLVDLSDFIDVVKNNRAVLDLAKLQRLADMVKPRGGSMVLRIVQDIDAGRRVRFDNIWSSD